MENERGLTGALAGFAAVTGAGSVPGEAVEHGKVAFMDWLGCAIGGSREPLVERLARVAEALGGNEQASVIGRKLRTSVAQAALINGAASHALDYDDTMTLYVAHPSVTLFPGLLALAEAEGKSGLEFLAAYLVGIQAGVVVGVSAGSEHYETGWHATSTVGSVAAAAACANLLGLDEEQARHAIGIGASRASGLKIMFGTDCKALQAGRAAETGVVAALLAREGLTSAADALEGPLGFFAAAKGAPDHEASSKLGRSWDVDRLAQKYHASCHYTHSPIEAARSVAAKAKIAVNEITRIDVQASRLALDAADDSNPSTPLEAKFSISYCVANALVHADTGVGAFTNERVADPSVRRLMSKTTVSVDHALTGMAARVDVESAAGSKTSAVADVFARLPALARKRERVRAKFHELCDPAWGRGRADKLVEQIDGLDQLATMKTEWPPAP